MDGMIDREVSKETGFRVGVHVTDIDPHGFTVHINSRYETKLYTCGIVIGDRGFDMLTRQTGYGQWDRK